MKTLEQKVATLPPWAREHITRLNEEIKVLRDGKPPVPKTRVIVDPHATFRGPGEEPVYLPDDRDVRFYLGTRKDMDDDCWIQFRIENGQFRGYDRVIYCSGGTGIVFLPNGGNCGFLASARF